MAMSRRRFLALASSGATYVGWRGRGWAQAAPATSVRRLVVIMLRGAVDGLNVVVPHFDPRYREMRPTIGLAAPGGGGGVIDLDGRFGLHPELASMLPLWRERRLAFVHACGSTDPTRSHFDAQDYMESGTPGVRATPDGWMNRLMSLLPGARDPVGALSVGPTRPRILSGPLATANFPLGAETGKPSPLDRPAVAAAFGRLYAGDDELSVAFRQGLEERRRLIGDLAGESAAADNGAPEPKGFPAMASRLARLLSRDDRIHLAFADLGGWDTHVNQGGATGQLANHLRQLGDGLAALAAGLGPRLDDTVVVVMSEFGRTARENGNRGTDHGHGTVMMVLGGRVRGGLVHGQWPGLEAAALYQGRDLAVTTDFRSVIAALLAHHLDLADRQILAVLPKSPRPMMGLFSV